jgi:uncharacterized protein (TIGR00645 family)
MELSSGRQAAASGELRIAELRRARSLAQMADPSFAAKPAVERVFERWLFRARWLLAPIYLGLVLALAGLVVVFVEEVVHAASGLLSMQPKFAIVNILSMIDLSLAANLVVIVVFSGYENFISRVDPDEARPSWMAEVDFAGLKLKLMGSIVAISAVALLRAFVEMSEAQTPPDSRTLKWMVGIHLTLVVSAVMLALMDFIRAKSNGGHA